MKAIKEGEVQRASKFCSLVSGSFKRHSCLYRSMSSMCITQINTAPRAWNQPSYQGDHGRIVCDLCEYKKKHYLITYDYYSRWIDILRFKILSEQKIKIPSIQFSTYKNTYTNTLECWDPKKTPEKCKRLKSRTLWWSYARIAVKHYITVQQTSKNTCVWWHFLLKLSSSKKKMKMVT